MKKLVLFVLNFWINIAFAIEPWLIKEEFLSPAQEDFDCHSSDIIETDPECFCAVWKGGPGKGKSNQDIKKNVGIWLSLYSNGQWSELQEIVKAPDSICWNPILCKLPDNELLLFFRIGIDPRHTISLLKRSYDGGYHWTNEEILPAGIVGPTKSKPIVTSSGMLICPSSIEVGSPEDRFKATAVWIELSEDGGKHWKKIGPLELPESKFGVIEPALFYDHLGRLKMLCRDRANKIGEKGFIWSAFSSDHGFTWSEFTKTALPNPDSGINVVDLEKGKIALVYNHSHQDRFPLHLAFSLDGGETWDPPFVLDAKGEFPASCLAKNGLLHITYATPNENTVQRRIKHLSLDLSLLPIQTFEIRAFISDLEKAKEILSLNHAVFKGEYVFTDYIYHPHDRLYDLNKEVMRLRVYQKTNWDQKRVELAYKTKSGVGIGFKKQFDTIEEAELDLGHHRLAFFYTRKGFEYELEGMRIFIEEIQGLPPSIEILSSKKDQIDHLFERLAPIQILSDSVPKLIENKK